MSDFDIAGLQQERARHFHRLEALTAAGHVMSGEEHGEFGDLTAKVEGLDRRIKVARMEQKRRAASAVPSAYSKAWAVESRPEGKGRMRFVTEGGDIVEALAHGDPWPATLASMRTPATASARNRSHHPPPAALADTASVASMPAGTAW